MSTVKILNVEINNISQVELLENLKSGGVVFTPNVDHIVKLQEDREFYRAYESADYRVCDSQILMYVARLLNKPIREKISGSDFFSVFYNHYKDDEDIKIFLLGAAAGVAAKAQQRINEKVGREIVVQAHSPSFGFENDDKESREIVDLINHSGATVLAIGVGAPKQEKWIYQYKDQLKNIKVMLAIGATIDFEAGHTQRASKWISHIGLEWLYRLICEPKRLWKRYLIEDLVFFWLVAKQMVLSHWPFQGNSSMGKSVGESTLHETHPPCDCNAKPLRILLVGPSLTQRGGMASVQNLILGNAPRSLCIKHIATHDEGSVLYRLWIAATALIAFVWNLLQKKVDLVHIHVSEKGSVFRKLLFLLITKAFRRPVVMHTHGCEFHLFHDNLSGWVRHLINSALQQVDYLVTLSESWKQYYVSHCGLDKSRVVVLPNPVNIPDNIPDRSGSPNINFAFLGRIGERKGAFDLIQAFANLPAECRNRAQLTLAGDGDIDQASDLIEKLNLTDRVKLPGWITSEQCSQLLKNSNVFILPSYNEGLPMAMLEAMAWGLPIISTPVGGIPEFIAHGEEGYLVNSGDIEALTASMKALIVDDSLRLAMGHRARQRMDPLDVNLYCKALTGIYYLALREKNDVISQITADLAGSSRRNMFGNR